MQWDDYLLLMEKLLLNFAGQHLNMRRIILAILLIGITACNETANEPVTTQTVVDTTAFTRQLSPPREQVILLPEAREITRDWLAYVTAENEINNFRNYTVNDVILNATPIAEIMNSLRETTPERFKATAVETRLSVLYTKAKVLEQKANKREIDPMEIGTIAEEIPAEFNNLKIQLNELFLKTLEDFEEELDFIDPEAEFNSRTNPGTTDTIAE